MTYELCVAHVEHLLRRLYEVSCEDFPTAGRVLNAFQELQGEFAPSFAPDLALLVRLCLRMTGLVAATDDEDAKFRPIMKRLRLSVGGGADRGIASIPGFRSYSDASLVEMVDELADQFSLGTFKVVDRRHDRLVLEGPGLSCRDGLSQKLRLLADGSGRPKISAALLVWSDERNFVEVSVPTCFFVGAWYPAGINQRAGRAQIHQALVEPLKFAALSRDV